MYLSRFYRGWANSDRTQGSRICPQLFFSLVPLRLTEAIDLSEMELKALAGRQLILEEEIQVKSNSIYIDEVICRQLHEPVTIHNY